MAKIDIGATIQGAFTTFFDDLPATFDCLKYLVLWWMAIVVGIAGLNIWLVTLGTSATVVISINGISSLIEAILYTAVILKYQILLFDRQLGGSVRPEWHKTQWNEAFLKTVWFGILLSLPTAPAVFAVYYFANFAGLENLPQNWFWAAPAYYLAYALIAVRLALVLPAVAAGESAPSLRKAWRMTQGNWLRLAAVNIGVILTLVLAFIVLGLVLAFVGGILMLIVTLILPPTMAVLVGLLFAPLAGIIQIGAVCIMAGGQVLSFAQLSEKWRAGWERWQEADKNGSEANDGQNATQYGRKKND